MKKRNVTTGEIVLYVLFSLLAAGGVTLITLGFIGNNLADVDNVLREANKAFAGAMKINFEVFGSLVLFLAAVLSAITLAVNGKRVEVAEEKRARRAQRLQLEDNSDI